MPTRPVFTQRLTMHLNGGSKFSALAYEILADGAATGITRHKRTDGRPKYYHDKPEPIDIQCAAQAIDTLAFVSDAHPESLELAARISRWTIKNMQAPDGHFCYRDLGWTKVKTPMLHWGQGTMFKALAHLLSKVNGDKPVHGCNPLSQPATACRGVLR